MDGAETLTMTEKEISRVQSAEMKPLRALLLKTRRDKIERCSKQMIGLPGLSKEIENNQGGLGTLNERT